MEIRESDIDVMDDKALRRAKLSKMIIEAASAGLLVLIYSQLLVTDDVKYRMRQKTRRWRAALLGPPPLTEQQIQQAERQVVIEAMRTVRYGE